MKRCVGMAILALVAAALLPVASSAGPAERWAPGDPVYGIGRQIGVSIEMADGIDLVADVFFPADGSGAPAEGPFPVILTQTPYGKTASSSAGIGYNPYLVERGYIHAVADVRGTGGSEGAFGLFDEIQATDGAWLVRWAAGLPNSTGEVGLLGPSYLGINQLFTAAAVGPGSPLKAIFPIVAGNDLYRDTAFDGGLLNSEFGPAYMALTAGGNLLNPLAERWRDPVGLAGVEVQHAGGIGSFHARVAAGILTNGDEAFDGEYWSGRRPADVLARVAANDIPAFLVGGWRDLFQRGAPMNYAGLQNAWAGRPVGAPMTADQPVTGRYQLLMGPWYHSNFGAGVDLDRIELQWFDTWLKGRDTGMAETTTPLHVYDIGTGKWTDTDRYPFTGARPATLFLGESGSLAPVAPEHTSADPIVFTGVASPCGLALHQWSAGGLPATLGAAGERCADDDRSQQQGPGARTYTSDPLPEAKVLAGPIGVTLFASSTRPETEWVAIVEDVAPDGTSRPLSSGALLGSFRQLEPDKTWSGPDGRPIMPYHAYTSDSAQPVEPGRLERYDIEVRPIFATLAAGHRLRLTLNTSATPHLTPTPLQLVGLTGGVYSIRSGGDSASASSIQLPLAAVGAIAGECVLCQ